MSRAEVSVGDRLQVLTERIAYGGDAVARHRGLAIFIPYAAPVERLRVRVIERKKNFARAVIEEILDPADSRRPAPCGYFGQCGGCQLQHLEYETQLQAKIGFVRDALERVGRIDWPHEIQIRHSGELNYRGRAQVKLERAADGAARVGFARAGSRSVCDVETCAVLLPELNSALKTLREAVHNSNDLIASPGRAAEINLAAGDLSISFEPRLSGFPGDPLVRKVGGFMFRFGPATFFQANPLLVDSLVAEVVGDETGSLAIDLFSGIGLFSLPLGRRFQRVIAVESDGEAEHFARENAAANGLVNVEVCRAQATAWLQKFTASQKAAPDLLLLDPPRSGAADAISHIATLKPRLVKYISCDPATLARDLSALVRSGYELRDVVAFDMFPQTYHVETVAVLALS